MLIYLLFRLDRDKHDGGIIEFARDDILVKFLSAESGPIMWNSRATSLQRKWLLKGPEAKAMIEVAQNDPFLL